MLNMCNAHLKTRLALRTATLAILFCLFTEGRILREQTWTAFPKKVNISMLKKPKYGKVKRKKVTTKYVTVVTPKWLHSVFIRVSATVSSFDLRTANCA